MVNPPPPTPRPGVPLRAAVVGSGGISREHLSFLTGRTALGPVADRAELVAVCDLSPAAANFATRTYGGRSFTDLATLLNDVKPDVVHVLTPPDTHLKLATMSLQAGAHVICEKPITPTSTELQSLLAIADRHGRRLMESHNYRFNTGIRDIDTEIARGELGSVSEVEVRITLPVTDPEGRFGDQDLPSPLHQMPAGVIHDFTTHFSYLLLHLSQGASFDRVAAAWSRHGDNELFRFDDLDALLIGENKQGPVHGRLRFDARGAPDAFTVTVRGTRGFAEIDLFQPYLREVRPRAGGGKLSPIVNHLANGASLVTSGVRNLGQKLLQHGPYEGLHRMLDLTYTALANGTEPPVTPDDMLRASELVDLLLNGRSRL